MLDHLYHRVGLRDLFDNTILFLLIERKHSTCGVHLASNLPGKAFEGSNRRLLRSELTVVPSAELSWDKPDAAIEDGAIEKIFRKASAFTSDFSSLITNISSVRYFHPAFANLIVRLDLPELESPTSKKPAPDKGSINPAA